MIIHLHLFVTILQTKFANFAPCNNLFIQTCIFAVHFFLFQCYLWLRILLQPFCCQYDDTMSSGDVRLLFMYKWTSIFHLATKPQHFHAGRCLPQLGLIKRLSLRECFDTIYYVWWCQIRNMHLLVSLPPPSMFPFTGKTWPIRNINNSCPDHLTYKRFPVDQPNITNIGQHRVKVNNTPGVRKTDF